MKNISTNPSRILLLGAKGMLAQAVLAIAPVECEIIGLSMPDVDITRRESVEGLASYDADVIINCAAYTSVDGCETERELAMMVNGKGPGLLADLARETAATLVHISTDYVFPGDGNMPLKEDDPTGPQSVYGETKLAGEKAILASGLEKYFILRTSWLYGPGGNNFVETILRLAGEREEIGIVADQVGTPTYTRDLATAIFSLLNLVTRYGTYNFSNEGSCSWYEFSCEIVAQARSAGIPLIVKKINPISTEEYPLPARRPAYSVFSKEKYTHATDSQIPTWQKSLKDYFEVRSEIARHA